MRLRPVLGLLAVLAALPGAPAWAAGLGEAQVRAFVAQQQRAWNAGDLDAFYGGFEPDATFTDQYRTLAGQVVPYGASRLAQARIESRKVRATSKVTEQAEIVRVALGADGRTAEVVSRVVSRTHGPGGVRVACAERRQELVLDAGRLRSKGQTDTYARCGR